MRLRFWKRPVVEKPLMPVAKSKNRPVMRTAQGFINGPNIPKYVPPAGCQLTPEQIHPVVVTFEKDKKGNLWQYHNGVRVATGGMPYVEGETKPIITFNTPRKKRFWHK